MEARRVVVGIGNPGAEYRDTRHNVGFMVLDQVAERLGSRLVPPRPAQRSVSAARSRLTIASGVRGDQGEPFSLVEAADLCQLLRRRRGPAAAGPSTSDPESLFVVVDDLNLPLGRIRDPAGGELGWPQRAALDRAARSADAEYPRLRLGIGQADDSTAVEHVLGPFDSEERDVVDLVLARAADAVRRAGSAGPRCKL